MAHIANEDAQAPRISLAQAAEPHVPRGAIYATLGSADPQPIVLKQPMRFYVLSLHKGRSYVDVSGDLQRLRYGGPTPPLSDVKDEKPWNIYPTYDYTIAVPEHDDSRPYKLFLCKRWGKQAAHQINLSLLHAQYSGRDSSDLPLDLSTKRQRDERGPWISAVVSEARS